MVFSNFIFGQITLEKTYSSENLQVYTNATETYYYTIGDGITDVKFYKSDYTIYKQFTPIIFLDKIQKYCRKQYIVYMQYFTWGYSSSGRAAALQAVGGRFESD